MSFYIGSAHFSCKCLSVSIILDHLHWSDVVFLICRVSHHPPSLQPSPLLCCLHLHRLSLFLCLHPSSFFRHFNVASSVAHPVLALQGITSLRIFLMHQTKCDETRQRIRITIVTFAKILKTCHTVQPHSQMIT